MTEDDQWLTRDEAAERLHVNVRTIDRWVAQGWLDRYETPSRRPRFKVKDVDELARPRKRS